MPPPKQWLQPNAKEFEFLSGTRDSTPCDGASVSNQQHYLERLARYGGESPQCGQHLTATSSLPEASDDACKYVGVNCRPHQSAEHSIGAAIGALPTPPADIDMPTHVREDSFVPISLPPDFDPSNIQRTRNGNQKQESNGLYTSRAQLFQRVWYGCTHILFARCAVAIQRKNTYLWQTAWCCAHFAGR